ncbi:MAG: PDZ domain-containing protein [Candidatus Pacearchaeota archaeon]
MKLTWKIWVLIISLVFALLMVHPRFDSGVVISSIDLGSPAHVEGLVQGDIIKEVNGQIIETVKDYNSAVEGLFLTNERERIAIRTKDNEFIFLANSLNISVADLPKTNIKTGLDLSGGARAIVKAQDIDLTQEQLQDLVDITSQRLNAFGLRDIIVRPVSDLGGNRYLLVEVAGATPDNLRSLISEQGKFEAKIGNKTAFTGGDKDITHVFRNDATQSAVYLPEQSSSGGYVSRFSFAITLSPEAAQRHADITKGLSIDPASGGQYLSENLTLLLDGEVVDELRISTGLRGQVTSQISIQGSGVGTTPEAALADARASMHKLQTVLITGSLPYKLEIIKIDTISPALGQEFTKSLILLGISVFIIVSLIIFIRYRKLNLSFAVILTMFSEAFITIGIAALLGWNLDAPGIAGIIAGIGTGVGDQILLLDASRKDEKEGSLREKVKLAFFIIVGSFATNVASMMPLFWTGAGMLKGFALTTILGVSVGILITRPAFADIIKNIEHN